MMNIRDYKTRLDIANNLIAKKNFSENNGSRIVPTIMLFADAFYVQPCALNLSLFRAISVFKNYNKAVFDIDQYIDEINVWNETVNLMSNPMYHGVEISDEEIWRCVNLFYVNYNKKCYSYCSDIENRLRDIKEKHLYKFGFIYTDTVYELDYINSYGYLYDINYQ